MAMVDNMLSLDAFLNANFFATGQLPVPTGNDHALITVWIIPGPDGEIAIRRQRWRVSQILAGIRPRSADGAGDFRTNNLRVHNRAAINAIITERIAQARKAFSMRIERRPVPYGVIMNGRTFEIHRCCPRKWPHHRAPWPRQHENDRLPHEFYAAPCTVHYPAPELSSHTDSVFRGLGYSGADVASCTLQVTLALNVTPRFIWRRYETLIKRPCEPAERNSDSIIR